MQKKLFEGGGGRVWSTTVGGQAKDNWYHLVLAAIKLCGKITVQKFHCQCRNFIVSVSSCWEGKWDMLNWDIQWQHGKNKQSAVGIHDDCFAPRLVRVGLEQPSLQLGHSTALSQLMADNSISTAELPLFCSHRLFAKTVFAQAKIFV